MLRIFDWWSYLTFLTKVHTFCSWKKNLPLKFIEEKFKKIWLVLWQKVIIMSNKDVFWAISYQLQEESVNYFTPILILFEIIFSPWNKLNCPRNSFLIFSKVHWFCWGKNNFEKKVKKMKKSFFWPKPKSRKVEMNSNFYRKMKKNWFFQFFLVLRISNIFTLIWEILGIQKTIEN